MDTKELKSRLTKALNEQIGLMNKQTEIIDKIFDEYENQKQELELKASDFPYIGYAPNPRRIVFCTKTNSVGFTNKRTEIWNTDVYIDIRSNVDNIVKVTKCTFLDIKNGDYYYIENNICNNYKDIVQYEYMKNNRCWYMNNDGSIYNVPRSTRPNYITVYKFELK